jgi:FkbM family methyltransferase
MTPGRGSRPADDELIEAVDRSRGAVLLVGAWASKTILAVASRSPDTSVIALTEADAARIRGLATAERLPMRVYLPSAVLDPMIVRDRHTGTVRWTADLLGPVPALSRVAVAGFTDAALAATLRTLLPAETIVVAGDVQAVPKPSVPKCYPVLDSLETVAHAAGRPTARAVFSSLGIDFEDLLASEDPGVSFNSLPVSSLTAIWHALAPTPVLGPSPGWRFDDAWMDDDPLVRLRRRLWECLTETSPGAELQLRWFGGIKLRTRIGTDLAFQLFVAGRYEPNELFAFAAALPRGGIAIDAGANEGLYTLLGAVRVGSAGSAVAIEPSDRELAILEDNIATNGLGNVTVEPIALLDRPGETKLRIAEFHHAGQNTLGSFVYEGVRASTTVTVHADRLDSVIDKLRLPRVDVLKLDVEGAEHCVLRGARQVLRRLRPFMILELQNDSLHFMGSSRLEVIAELRSHDYDVRDFHPETGLVGPPSCDDDTLSLNVMAAPDGCFPPALLPAGALRS